jgi:hypothetical protein
MIRLAESAGASADWDSVSRVVRSACPSLVLRLKRICPLAPAWQVMSAWAWCVKVGEPLLVDDPMGERGRGLLLVRGLAIRVRVCGDHRGRLVWADVRWEQEGGAQLASGVELEGMYGAGERALRQLL